MSRLVTQFDIASAPEGPRPLLSVVQRRLGSMPDLFRVVASSPVALEGDPGLGGARARGRLLAATREPIALTVARVNGCGDGLAAYSFLAGATAKLDAEEIAANRRGPSKDAKATAAAHAADLDDAEIVEIVPHVPLNTRTSMLNRVVLTEVNLPTPSAGG